MTEKNPMLASAPAEQPARASVARRTFLLGSAIAATAFAVPVTPAAAASHAHTADPTRDAVLEATAACIREGQHCDQHCLEMFTRGDVSLAECARLVRELVTVCAATNALGVQGAARFAAMVDLCAQTCAACEKECRRHAEKHEACASCAEACAAGIQAAAAFKAART